MSRSFWALVAFGLLLPTVSGRAQEAAPIPPFPIQANNSEVTLEELLRRALETNPQPQIAAANLEAARARAGASRAGLNPVLQIVPGVGGNREARDEEIILSQTIDVFGQRRATRRVFDAQVRRAQAEQTLATRSLIIQVKNATADLFAAQEAESLGQSQVEIARAFRNAADRKAKLGDAPPVQTQRAQLELDRAQVELDQTRAERLSRQAVLNQLIGAPPEAPLRVALPDLGIGSLPATTNAALPSVSPDANSLKLPPAPLLDEGTGVPMVGASSQIGSDLVASRAALLPGALQRPDILAAQASVEAAQAQADVIARQKRPQIEIQARRNGVFDSGSMALRAVITVPLFDLGSIKRERRAAQFEAQAQQGQVTLLRSQAAAQVESALVRLQQNRLTAQRYRTSLVPQTLDLLRKTQIGYAAGASTYLEVLEAQRALRQIQTEYLQALVGARSGEAALESALGSNLSAVTGDLNNPSGPDRPDGVAAPGTVPSDTIPLLPQEPLNPPSSNLPSTNNTSNQTTSTTGGR